MAFKIINGLVILEPNMMPKIQKQSKFRQCNEAKVGFKNQLEEPQSRLKIVNKTFFYSTPTLWNHSIGPTQANAPSVEAFKQHFRK